MRVWAGPILRHCSPDAVCIWFAIDSPCQVSARVFPYKTEASSEPEPLGTGDALTVPLAKHLHLAVVVVKPKSGRFPTETLLGYNAALAGTELERVLKREDFVLSGMSAPTFFLPGGRPHGFLHGSCRKPHGKGADAMPLIADDLEGATTDLSRRPAFLLLTGDQIYADDVDSSVLQVLKHARRWLCSDSDDERLPSGIKRQSLATGRASFIKKLGFKTDEGANHLIFFDEFCSMYLLAWSPELVGALRESKTIQHRYAVEAMQKNEALKAFLGGLKRVRLALANIPTYMIFDDHEVTDDWFLDEPTRKSMLSTPDGERIIANALRAFYFFQFWGNAPEDFGPQGPFGALLVSGEDREVARARDWGFVTPTSPPIVFVDTRTARGTGPAPTALLDDKMMAVVIARCENASRRGAVIVVSPAPVFGEARVERWQETGADLFSPEIVDYEVWTPHARERFLDALFRKVSGVAVFLSGDVHYGFSYSFTRSRFGALRTAVQLTSSSFKNATSAVFGLYLSVFPSSRESESGDVFFDAAPELMPHQKAQLEVLQPSVYSHYLAWREECRSQSFGPYRMTPNLYAALRGEMPTPAIAYWTVYSCPRERFGRMLTSTHYQRVEVDSFGISVRIRSTAGGTLEIPLPTTPPRIFPAR